MHFISPSHEDLLRALGGCSSSGVCIVNFPKRVTPRFHELSPDEVIDLYTSVHLISKRLENAYDAEALNIAVQDGLHAGQSVPHVQSIFCLVTRLPLCAVKNSFLLKYCVKSNHSDRSLEY